MTSKRLLASVVVALVVVLGGGPAGAGAGMTVLGTDPAMDAPPGGDLTQLAVTTHGSDLHVQLTLANSIPVAGTYGAPTGIQWAFEVRGKTFVAEAYPSGVTFRYVLFEKKGETFEQVAMLEGEFDTIAGVLDIFVPLKEIGAKKGTLISGAGKNDVDVHIHGLVTTLYPDQMTTKKGYVVR